MLPKKSLKQLEQNLYSDAEEFASTASHAIGFLLALIGLFALLKRADSQYSIFIVLIYGLSLAGMFLSSTFYHASKDQDRKLLLRKVDHIAIYLLIAGSYTPFLLLGVKSQIGIIGTVVVWLIASLGVFFKLIFGHKYPKLSISTYGIMGWLALFLIYPIYQSLSGAGFALLVIGGLCYSAGIPLYLLKSRHYSHALWHICVVAGAACHFFAIYFYVL